MARMIPSLLSPEVTSTAERRIFEWFRDDPDTDGWVVLHSLGIANHRSLMYGEIDFFVVAPKLGIFALEVKGGRVRRVEGLWHFTDRYGRTVIKQRGPFEQANAGIYSLIDSIKKKCGQNSKLSGLLFGSGVMFPDIIFDTDTLEANDWQVFDLKDGNNTAAFIRRLSLNYRRKWEKTYGAVPQDKIPDRKDVKELANLLRGDFDKVISLSTQIKYSESDLITLTDEQLLCIDQLEDNPRCLIQGAAGTGKTLIALEEVRRSVVRGEKVALFCYNAMLARWLKESFRKSKSQFVPAYVGTLHSFMLQIADEAKMAPAAQEDEIQDFWDEELPIIALEAAEQVGICFDRVIVDEAQDLATGNYFDVFDVVLRGGINRGHWSLFGDFTWQTIYNRMTAEGIAEFIGERTAYIRYKLRINCRNTRQIGEEIKHITGFESLKYLDTKVNGPPVSYYTYTDSTAQKEILNSVLHDLIKCGVEPGDITILSPVKREESIVNELKFSVNNYLPDIVNQLTFSTIHSYKGIENAVIVLTDISTYDNNSLIYIGYSRARSFLIVMEAESARRERINLLMRWIK